MFNLDQQITSALFKYAVDQASTPTTTVADEWRGQLAAHKGQVAEDIQEMKSLILSQNTSPSERAQIHNQFDPAEDKMKKAAPVSHAALHLFSGKEKT